MDTTTLDKLTEIMREGARALEPHPPDEYRVRTHRDVHGQLWAWYWKTGWVRVQE